MNHAEFRYTPEDWQEIGREIGRLSGRERVELRSLARRYLYFCKTTDKSYLKRQAACWKAVTEGLDRALSALADMEVLSRQGSIRHVALAFDYRAGV